MFTPADPLPGTHLSAEIRTQPDDWARAREIADRYSGLLPHPGERVAVLGCGTSLFIARAYAALREELGQGLTDAWPAGQVPARDYDRFLVICRSGTTTEVLDAMRALPAGPARTVIGSSPGTPALELGDAILMAEIDERSVVQSRFATTTLALLRWHLGQDLAPVIEQARAALAEDPALTLAEVRAAQQITFVGMGFAAALGDEAALKLREASQSWTESYLATEYRHGPISIAAPGRAVWGLGALPEGLADQVAAAGAHVELRAADPMAELVRVHRLCLLRAADLGVDPDNPRNLSRSVILG
ncbi:SIS domain-containing protein [Nocardia seriolae]|uniref:Glutamine--fructose-6-phosphate transaminase (Isomerizing) n=1 Tax=Nocardia seriolae TaxID=37332 RepID=A0A0B8N9J6_9NOCA|nr:sugar isomerase [Nocardia seriolae]APA96399.1 Glutamine--fructose-6-phosphate transaminase (isomerizing) [Nocardia seriolae]MTJ61472.1 sugar isomerase [Nocardia seriolae]MTJ71675.1 sugar isomerase [Nocardia seriolae]MTJ86504.1 sugar isomerase [Nocardia seriolae]MTK30497.1 sugar isomerase [Nocardia seriolae]